MKKNLLLVLVFNSLLGFSQQAIKHRQSDIVMKYLALANGTNPSVITGPNNINSGQSDDVSSVFVMTPEGVFLDAPQINANIPTTIPNETIGATTLTFNNALENINQTSGEIQLTFIQKDARVNTNGDNFPDGNFTVWTLPTEQANGEPIPNNTWTGLTRVC